MGFVTYMKTDKISFGARFINPVNVGKLDGKTYRQVDVSFVEINPFDADDIKALRNIAKYWKDDKFITDISVNADMIFKEKSADGIKIYALTSQGDSFEKLEPDRILGVIETEDNAPFHIYINRFQVKPDYVYKRDLEYSGIGTAILNSLKEMCNKISAISERDEYVRKFYERNGFYETSDKSNFYTWYKDYFADIFKIYR
ncbi:GNAT family N-acetyltransferase [bacterium]|nr:GNAT family N-acetyltransferase [bacterium]